MSDDEIRLGTAAWADHKAVAKAREFRPGGIFLGRVEDGTAVGCRDDRHVILVSGNRGGKGTSSIVPNLCTYPGSAVVVDPKSENATVTAARRGHGTDTCVGMGQDVYVLDPYNEAVIDGAYRASFNPLDSIDPSSDQAVDDVGRLADAIVVVRPDAKDPFFDESARTLVKALILYVLVAPQFAGRRNLLTVRQLITRGDHDAFEALGDEAGAGPSAHALLCLGMKRSPDFAGVLAGAGATFVDMLQASPGQFQSVLQIASRNTEFLDSPAMARVLTTSSFKLSDLKASAKGMTVYLSLPAHLMPTHFRWLRMMITLVTAEMQRVRGKPATGHPVLMLLDEFAGLQRMEVIENAVAQIAGFGVKLFMVLQSLEQLKAIYKFRWETFLANAGVKIFFSVEDHFTREYVSKLLGETEVIRNVRSETDNETASVNLSETDMESEAISAAIGGGTSVGVSDQVTRGDAHGVGGSSSSKSRSRGFQATESTHYTNSDTRVKGKTKGVTYGLAGGHTTGLSETVHRRPLLAPEEIGRKFARIDDPRDANFPGLGLAIISGCAPISLRRVNYFDDHLFMGCFSQHPDHPMRPLEQTQIAGGDLAGYLGFLAAPAVFGATPVELSACVARGQWVKAGQAVAQVRMADKLKVAIRAPRAGKIEEVNGFEGDGLPDTLMANLHYPDPSHAQSAYADLATTCLEQRQGLRSRRIKWAGWSALAVLMFSLQVVGLTNDVGPGMALALPLGLGGLCFFKLRRIKEALVRYPHELIARSLTNQRP